MLYDKSAQGAEFLCCLLGISRRHGSIRGISYFLVVYLWEAVKGHEVKDCWKVIALEIILHTGQKLGKSISSKFHNM